MKTIYRLLFYLTLISIVKAGESGDASPSSRTSLSRSELIRIVLEANPTLKAARAKWEAMKQRVPQARAWEDVKFNGQTRTQRSVPMEPNTMMDSMAMLEQEIPVTGKNLSRGRVATAEARATFEEFRRTELDVVMRARIAYARLANGYSQLEVNRRNSDLLDQFVQISQSRYETGTASQADVLIAQTDAAKLLEARADLERQISEAQSALNVLMNRPAQTPLDVSYRLAFTGENLSLQKLQTFALAQRPEMQRAQDRVEAERSRLELANRQWFPDPALNVQTQRYNSAAQGISEVDVGVSFPLPFLNFKKYGAGVQEARKSLENAQHEFDGTRSETFGLVRDQLKKIQTSANQYQLYQEKILPVARQTVDAGRAAYEASTGGFLELITARRTLQDAESAALNHLADHEVAIAELDAIVGRNVEEQK